VNVISEAVPQCQDEEDETNNLRVYADGETDRDETQSVTCSIPSIIKNDLEESTTKVAAQHNEFSELLNRMNTSRYDPINESSNSLNWTLVQPNHQPLISKLQHQVSLNNSPFNMNMYHQNTVHHEQRFQQQPHHPNKRMRYEEQEDEARYNRLDEVDGNDQSMNNEALEYSGQQMKDESDDQQILDEFIDECYNQPNGSYENEDQSKEESYEEEEEYNEPLEETEWQSNTNSNRITLPKIDEAAEEEELSSQRNEMNKKKSAIHNKPGPVIQMTKTALLRANKLKEMKSASSALQAASLNKRAKPLSSANTQSSVVSRQVNENFSAIDAAKKTAAQQSSGCMKKTANTANSGSNRLSNISVLTAMNMHASKFNKN
jgi:hypothetical protein